MAKLDDAEIVRDCVVPLFMAGIESQLRLLERHSAELGMALVSLNIGMVTLGTRLAQKYPAEAETFVKGSQAAASLGGDQPLEMPERVTDELVDALARTIRRAASGLS